MPHQALDVPLVTLGGAWVPFGERGSRPQGCPWC